MTFKVRYSRKVYIGKYETFDIELIQEFADNRDIHGAMNETQDLVEMWCKMDRIPPHSWFYRRNQMGPSGNLEVQNIDEANKRAQEDTK